MSGYLAHAVGQGSLCAAPVHTPALPLSRFMAPRYGIPIGFHWA